jgi:hypothetical protein
MGKLDGKVAPVTGASSGVCFATAQEFPGKGMFTTHAGRPSLGSSPAGGERRRRSPEPSSFWHPTTAATSGAELLVDGGIAQV